MSSTSRLVAISAPGAVAGGGDDDATTVALPAIDIVSTVVIRLVANQSAPSEP
jgi:hypothetical protein